jgi:hypothetical protein
MLGKSKTSTNVQITTNRQAFKPEVWSLVLSYWNLFGVWCLVIGICEDRFKIRLIVISKEYF